jgi:hypothetical protein
LSVSFLVLCCDYMVGGTVVAAGRSLGRFKSGKETPLLRHL